MSNFTWRATRGVLAIMAAVLLLTVAAPAQESSDLGGMLQQTELKNKALGSDAWTVPFDGSDGKSFDVYVTYSDDSKKYVLIFTTVVNREDGHVFGADFMRKALELSNDLAGVKFVLDSKRGDLDCQTELETATLTVDSLKRQINHVAAAADETRSDLNSLAP